MKIRKHWREKHELTLYTLSEEIFAGTNFCSFGGFGLQPQN